MWQILKTFFASAGLFLALVNISSADNAEIYPEPLLHLDNFFSHHVLIAEKATHQLYLYENVSTYPKLLQVFQMATGKKAGNKIFQGDYRTPEGIYQLKEFIPNSELIAKYGKEGEIYGVGAFVLDYPNPIDRLNGKTGGGIWLHSTNDETRIDKGLDSRGCIVTANKELIDISKYIELNKTTLVVVQDLHFLRKESWDAYRNDFKKVINDWMASWQSEDFQKYISFYHKQDFSDPIRGSYGAFKQYKKAVFDRGGAPKIEFDNLSVLKTRDYAIVTFKQIYSSDTINDIGKKTLYLKRDEYYNWKIVSEVWNKIGTAEGEQVAFRPSLRFFNGGELKEGKN